MEALKSALKSSKTTIATRVPPSRLCRETSEYLPRSFRVVLKPLRARFPNMTTEIDLEA